MRYLLVLVLAVALSAAIVAITTGLWNIVAVQFSLPMTTFWVTYCIYALLFLVSGILGLGRTK